MTDRTYDLALKCPRCWGASLFASWKPGFHEVAAMGWYDRAGADPVKAPGGATYLCTLCGGYMDLHARRVGPTDPALRAEIMGGRRAD